jgi:hypothetical protein
VCGRREFFVGESFRARFSTCFYERMDPIVPGS